MFLIFAKQALIVAVILHFKPDKAKILFAKKPVAFGYGLQKDCSDGRTEPNQSIAEIAFLIFYAAFLSKSLLILFSISSKSNGLLM